MKEMILSKAKKIKGYDNPQFTKQEVKEARVFMYDLFFFDYGGKRFGFEVDDIIKFRKEHYKKLDKILAEGKK